MKTAVLYEMDRLQASITQIDACIDREQGETLYRLQNSMNRRIYCQRVRSMGELFSGFEV